jgi:hypothetical protein
MSDNKGSGFAKVSRISCENVYTMLAPQPGSNPPIGPSSPTTVPTYLTNELQVAEPFVCGGTAASFASVIIHPIDLAKVRFFYHRSSDFITATTQHCPTFAPRRTTNNPRSFSPLIPPRQRHYLLT